MKSETDLQRSFRIFGEIGDM